MFTSQIVGLPFASFWAFTMHRLLATIALALGLMSNHMANAAQFRYLGHDPKDVIVELTGEIQPSDFGTLKQMIERRLSSNTRIRWVSLNSQGGDLATAMRIGRYIRQLEFDTQVHDDARCLSSCVFILAAGLYKTVANSNVVGIHRPYRTTVGYVSRDEATKKYQELADTIFAYFDEMHLPRSLPEQMLRIPSGEMTMLKLEEVQRFGLVGKDPVAEEMDDAANAEKFGLTRTEYLARRNHALRTCTLSWPDFSACYKAVLRGQR